MKKELIPVLHVRDKSQVIENVELLKKLGIVKIFLIDHNNRYNLSQMIHLCGDVKDKGLWCGVNFLSVQPDFLLGLTHISDYVDGLWYDNSYVGLDNSKAAAISRSRDYNPDIETYGGVAFKYLEQPKDLKLACELAINMMDIVVTSGARTAEEPSIEKISEMKSYLGDKKLAVASGITAQSVNKFPCDIVMVSSSICKDFYNFDEQKIVELQEAMLQN